MPPVAHDDAHSGAHAAPEPPAETDTEIGEFEEIGAWTLNDEASARDAARTGQAPNAPDAHAPDIARAESPPEPEDPETVPTDELARQRRRAGPAVSAHADNDGIAPTIAEKRRVRAYLAGSAERPSLPAALDETAADRFAGKPDRDPFALACRSPAGAAAAHRLTHTALDAFEDEHRETPRADLLTRFLDEWRTLRRGLLRKIFAVVVPLEVQDDRARRAGRLAGAILDSAARRPDRHAVRDAAPLRVLEKPAAKPEPTPDTTPALQRPSGPDFSM